MRFVAHAVIVSLVFGLGYGCKRRPPPNPDLQTNPSHRPPQPGSTINKKNRLALESSPYLIQHAANPVDWYPWEDAAFDKARKENKPIFLSIGYATCHWCHVMETESFEDPEVASRLNDVFVSIKVDKEERPDIDHVYMTVCQMMTGSGGWPLTIIMTPDKQPFFAATYIPKHSRFNRKGLMEIIEEIDNLWKTNPESVLESAKRIVAAVANTVKGETGAVPGTEAIELAYFQLKTSFDAEHGGFGNTMKFPTPHQLTFLLRYYHRTGNTQALHMVEKTLTAMAEGGIFDHLGGGFHRYATDPAWRIPHFEKMLYDQAQLLDIFVEAYQVKGELLYRQTAQKIADYVLRDMTHTNGGFFSAEDADSEGVEGKFYLWRTEEIDTILEKDEADVIHNIFDIRPDGNLNGSLKADVGQNILYKRLNFVGVAAQLEKSVAHVETRYTAAIQKLFNHRQLRKKPFKDDKILTDWNGLMLGALAKAGRLLKEDRYVEAAKKNAAFILANLKKDNGRLMHRYRNGKAGLPAHLNDYAFLVHGLLELYESTFDSNYLIEARKLTNTMIALFSDPRGGALFATADDTETVIVRAKDIHDGALPSGNSIAMTNILKLARITGLQTLEDNANEIAKGFGGQASQDSPKYHTNFLLGLDFAIGPSVEVVIAGKRDADDSLAMLNALRGLYCPRKVVLFRDEDNLTKITSVAPFVTHQPMKSNRATAYVCINQACSFPTTSPQDMVSKILTKTKPRK